MVSLAADFKKYLESKPDAHLILGGHADHRGSVEYNQALSERRVNRTKSFLVEQGVPEANIDTKAFGKEQNLTDDDVKGEVASNPDLTSEERARILKNIVVDPDGEQSPGGRHFEHDWANLDSAIPLQRRRCADFDRRQDAGEERYAC